MAASICSPFRNRGSRHIVIRHDMLFIGNEGKGVPFSASSKERKIQKQLKTRCISYTLMNMEGNEKTTVVSVEFSYYR